MIAMLTPCVVVFKMSYTTLVVLQLSTQPEIRNENLQSSIAGREKIFENAGFQRLATKILELANTYDKETERIILEHNKGNYEDSNKTART